jgi:chromosome partitioning protein
MRRVVFNQKGGVGKTTITCNLAAISAAKGLRTLLVDLDYQSNATQYLLGQRMKDLNKTVADFFKEMLSLTLFSKSLKDYIVETPFKRLDILPAHRDLDELHTRLESRYKIYKLRDAFNKLSWYDAIYIDTPPALNFYTRSALIASDACLIPFDCDDFSRHALYNLLDNVREIQNDHNPDLKVEGIIVNQFQSRARQNQQIVDELKAEGLPLIDVYLSSSVRIRESHEKSKPMVEFDPKHKITLEFHELFNRLRVA